ncbi:aromatic-ring-hydroxylating dioxygenase subunit beta [Pelagerythrobacter aerophilus]
MENAKQIAAVMGADKWDGDPQLIADRDVLHRVQAFINRESRLLDTMRVKEWLAEMIDPDIRYVAISEQLRYLEDRRYDGQPDAVFIYDDDYNSLNARVEQQVHPQNWRINPAESYVRLVSNLEVAQGDTNDRLLVRTNWHVRRMRRQYEIDDFIYARHDELVVSAGKEFKFVKRFISFPERCVSGRNMTLFL